MDETPKIANGIPRTTSSEGFKLDLDLDFFWKDFPIKLSEDVTIKRIGGNVALTYKELKSLQTEVTVLKQSLEQTLISQQERIEIRRLELEHERELKKIEYDKQRELESHQWERSLPLQSDTVGEITKSLNSVKTEDIGLVKTGRNGRNGKTDDDGSISYENLLSAYEQPLAAVGIEIHNQLISGFDLRSGDILKTTLIHTSGEFFASYSKLKIDQVPSCSCAQQQRSSALSYAKRHNLQSLLGQ